MAEAQVIAYLSTVPVSDIRDPAIGCAGDLYDVQILSQTIGELAEHFESHAEGYWKDKFGQLARLSWIVAEKVTSALDKVNGIDDFIAGHSFHLQTGAR